MYKKMSYAFYKKYYSEFPSRDYDKSSKTIMVDLPKVKRMSIPKEWEKHPIWNYYIAKGEYGNIHIYMWGTGFSKQFHVERMDKNVLPEFRAKADIYPCIDSFERLIDLVSKFQTEKDPFNKSIKSNN